MGFVTLGYAPFRTSGLDVSGERFVRAMAAAGNQMVVIAAGESTRLRITAGPNVQLNRLRLGPGNWITHALRASILLKRLAQEIDFDVVHFWDVHFAYAYDGDFVASLHQSFRQRLDLGPRMGYLRIPYYLLARVLAERPAARRARGLFAVSHATRREFLDGHGLPEDRIVTVYHGIDTERFRPARARASLRRRVGLLPEEPVILFAGFVTPRKGIDLLAEVLARVRSRVTVVTMGKWSRRALASFDGTIKRLGMNHLALGFVPDVRLPEIYAMADIYASASLLEGFGLPLAEALACGTPCVAFDAGAAREVIGPGGKVVAPGDVDEFASVMTSLLTDQALRAELGRRGREHVQQHFSVGQMVRGYSEGYNRFFRRVASK